jgi:hypothetical protein
MDSVTDLLPDSASIQGGVLTIAGVPADELARDFGTPVVVYDEATIRSQARAYREAAPGALVVYGTKEFPSLAVMRLLADEGPGADVRRRRARVRAPRPTGERPVIQQRGGRAAAARPRFRALGARLARRSTARASR